MKKTGTDGKQETEKKGGDSERRKREIDEKIRKMRGNSCKTKNGNR